MLIDNIASIIDEIDMLLLWKNSICDLSDIVDDFNCKGNKIEVVGDESNKGIAFALNYAWHYADKNHFDYILTMDQDSIFENFDIYKKSCLDFYNTRDCIIGPLYNKSVVSPSEFVLIESPFLITSGMIVSVNVLNKIDGYDEKLFVDCVDVDMCTKCIINNIPLYQFNGAKIRQHFGEPKKKKFLGKCFKGTDYNKDRLFNIFKNILIIYKRYNKPSFLRKKIFEYYRNFISDVITSDTKRCQKLFAIIQGSVRGYLY